MPPLRPQAAPPDRGRAATTLGTALVTPAPPAQPGIRQLITGSGGTRAAAALVGRSPRTLRRWAAGQVQTVPAEAQQTLARASTAARNRRLIDEMGGVRRVSQVTGRSVRTVQRWARGEIRQPRLDAQAILQRADAAVRMRDLGLQIDPATGQPEGQIYLKLSGSIRINASTTAGYSYPARAIGGNEHPMGRAIDDQVIADMVQAIGQGDPAAAQAALEEYLSNDYAAVGNYDQQRQIGLFIDSITSVEFNQVPTSPPPTPATPPPAPPRARSTTTAPASAAAPTAPRRSRRRRPPETPPEPDDPGTPPTLF